MTAGSLSGVARRPLRARPTDGVRPQLVALSAVLGDLGGLDSWLDARALVRTERPVPLDEGVLRRDGTWRLIDPADGAERESAACAPEPRRGTAQDFVIPLLRRLVGEGKQVLVFRSTKPATRGCAAYLSRTLGLPPAGAALDALPSGDPSVASRQLQECLAGGIAFHNSDLDRHERLAVEQAFRNRDSSIRVMVATTTLAQGVNTPAEAVVVVELDHPRGNLPSTPYTVAEYKNIVGRAGRLGYTEAGESYLLVGGALDEDRKWSRYVIGTPEDVRSRLAGAAAEPEGLLLSVLATAPLAPQGCDTRAGLTAEEALQFLDLSLAAHQARREGRPEVFGIERLRGVIDNLVRHDLVRTDPEGRLHLTELGRLGAGGTVSAATLVRLVGGLRHVPSELFAHPVAGPAVLIATAQLTEELDEVPIPVNRQGWQKESQELLGELRRSGAGSVVGMLAQAERGIALARMKRAVACLLWIEGVPMGTIEQLITAHVPVRDAAGPVREAAGRTRDVLEVVGAVAGRLHPDALDIGALVQRLAVQLELGVGADMVELAGQMGRALNRGEYLSLAAAGLSTPDAVLGADHRLRDLLGPLADQVSAAARRAVDRRAAADEHGISHYLPAAGSR